MMKIRTLAIVLFTLGLGACASTWNGIQNDASRHADTIENKLDKAGNSIQNQWDRTKEGTKKRLDSTGNAIQEGWDKLTD